MTKKDYKIIAQVIKDAGDSLKNGTLDNPLLFISEHLAEVFKNDNPIFNYHKFFVACGLTE